MAAHRHPSWRITAAIVALAALWLAMLMLGGGTVDRAVYETLYGGRSVIVVAVARSLTAFGEPTILIAAGVACWLWLWFAGRARLGAALLTVAMLGRGLSEAQKYTIGRVRPSLEPHLVVVKSNSFPSGHAASSMIFYLTIAVALAGPTRWRFAAAGAAISFSLAIGTSRVVLGVHWPSDVIGGWAFGLLWVLLALRPAERLFRVNSPRPRNAL